MTVYYAACARLLLLSVDAVLLVVGGWLALINTCQDFEDPVVVSLGVAIGTNRVGVRLAPCRVVSELE